jgi:hypothetical protein
MKRLAILGLTAAAAWLPPAAVIAADTGYCSVPGELVAEDPSGDATLEGAAPDPAPGHDVQKVYAAEPGGTNQFALTLKVDTLSPEPTPNTIYYVHFILDDGIGYFVSYDPYALVQAPQNPARNTRPMFAYGHTEAGVGGVSSLVTDGAADAESKSDPDGTITWYVTKTKMAALPTSTVAASMVGEARAVIGTSVSGGLVTVVDDSVPGDYVLRGNSSCGGGKSGVLGLGALPLPGLLVLAGLAALRRRFR